MYYVYIVSNKNNTVTYIGVTNNIIRRIYEHKNKMIEGFTCKYNVNKLVYYEEYNEVKYAIEREKQLKGWSKSKKVDLINRLNSNWDELYNKIKN